MATPTDKQFSSIDTGLAQIPPKFADPILDETILDIYNAIRILQQKISNTAHFPAQASEDIAAGSLVATHTVAGNNKIRKASAADNTKVAVGYVSQDILSGTWAVVTTAGICPFKAALTPGTYYYLSDTTPGGVTSTKPVGAGKIVQPVGYATTATDLILNISLQFTQL